MAETQNDRTNRALNILAKWRVAFTGWQLGTRSKQDPEAAAVRDHREATLILRAELNAVVDLLIHKGLVAEEEFLTTLEAAARQLSKDLEGRFPGMRAVEHGLDMSFPEAAKTMKDWPR